MNCKQGDLAIVVRCRSDPSVIGKITRCVRLIEDVYGDTWEVDPPLGGWFIDATDPSRLCDPSLIADHCLRPLRDKSDDDDEIFRTAARSEQVTA